MTWLQRYRIRHYVGDSIWVPPVLSILAAIGSVRLLHWIETDMGWESPIDADTARAVLGTMASALFGALVYSVIFFHALLLTFVPPPPSLSY